MIKIINEKVDTLIEDDDKTELLNNINVTKRSSHLNLLEEVQLSTTTVTSIHLAQKIQAIQPSTTLTLMQGWELSGRKKLISLEQNKS